jgi:hypothetical protein
VKRARRGIVLGVLALLGGAVVSVMVAEGIGLSGAVVYKTSAPLRFVAAQGMYAQVRDISGPGWRYLDWVVIDQQNAAVFQYMYDNKLTSFGGRLSPSYLHPDAPGTLPSWSGVWRGEEPTGTSSPAAPRALRQAHEVCVGWPLACFWIDWHPAKPDDCHGGKQMAMTQQGGRRLLLWRPVALGFALDTLIYAACIAGLGAGVRLFVRARRKRRGACAGCGYDLKGLADGAACPECGRAERGAKARA